MVVRHLTDGQEIDGVLLVRGRSLRRREDGSAYLLLSLGDRTGTVAGVLQGDAECCTARRRGPRHRPLRDRRALRGADRAERGARRPTRSTTTRCSTARRARPARWRTTCATSSPRSRTGTCATLLDAVLGPASETWPRFRDAPAAKRYHQAYRHGLLEHSLTVAQSVSAIAATFPGIDRDVAVTGALLHDIGKLDAYTADPLAIDLTDAGKLQGEIALGYFRVRRLIEDLPGFPPHLAESVLHIILSHHGALEHGSPVVPCTREATLVHMIDNLGGRLGSFDRLEKALPDGSRWSGYDRALGGGAFFATSAAA